MSDYLEHRRKLKLSGKPAKEKKVYKIPARSKKRESEERIYFKAKKEYLTEHIRCEVPGCNQVAVELHHKKGRIGKLIYDKTYFMGVCVEHHRFIEDNPEAAKKNNFSVSRLKK